MSISRRHVVTSIIIFSIAGAFIGLLAYGLKLDPKQIPAAQLDKTANGFRAAWVQGQEFVPTAASGHFRLEDFAGKPLVLNFWASWCVSCREEARELEAFWQAHKADVAVVGIAIQDEPEAARKFAAYYGKTYILGMDEDGKAAIDYGVSGVPETFLIDRKGIIREKITGPVDQAKLTQLLSKIL